MPARLNCSAVRASGRAVRSQSSTVLPRSAIASLSQPSVASRHYSAAAAASSTGLGSLQLPDDYIPPTKPPSARRPEWRKSQLIRTYTALLRSTPLILFFQHNNLTAVEWAAIRRELHKSLQDVAPPVAGPDGHVPVNPADAVELTVLRTRMFDVAFKIVEYFDAEAAAQKPNTYAHDLSSAAYEAIKKANLEDPSSTYAQISPLLTGPVAALTIPIVSPAHLAAALKVLAPSAPNFPAPTRKKNPGYHDPITQSALQKLILMGGRIEGKAFDQEGINWVGGIEGGLDGLRSQVVYLLQSAGLGVTTVLEGHSKSLWLALEGRRTQLDEEQNPKKADEGEAKPEEPSS
jgi:large subunit ribosomal protein L10